MAILCEPSRLAVLGAGVAAPLGDNLSGSSVAVAMGVGANTRKASAERPSPFRSDGRAAAHHGSSRRYSERLHTTGRSPASPKPKLWTTLGLIELR